MSEYIPNIHEIPDTPKDNSGCKPKGNGFWIDKSVIPYKEYYLAPLEVKKSVKIDEPGIYMLFALLVLMLISGRVLYKLYTKCKYSWNKYVRMDKFRDYGRKL